MLMWVMVRCLRLAEARTRNGGLRLSYVTTTLAVDQKRNLESGAVFAVHHVTSTIS